MNFVFGWLVWTLLKWFVKEIYQSVKLLFDLIRLVDKGIGDAAVPNTGLCSVSFKHGEL